MKRFIFALLLLSFSSLVAREYLSNKSCNECHPDIYDEYKSSWHSKGYFNDELHHKASLKVPAYKCAKCHMPASGDKELLSNGTIKIPKETKRNKDAISCFYCHQIAFVKEAHKSNDIMLARQAEGLKPTLYGSLQNPDSSDKHEMVKSPIYEKYACIGCHSHKRNENGVLIFRATNKGEGSKDCIKCHMPYIDGGVEKMNRKSRQKHRSHYFAGIHDEKMRQKSVDIKVSPQKESIDINITNKMGHPLILQAARMKYLKISLYRGGKEIWSNFKKDPREDKQGTFTIDYLDENGTITPIPFNATKRGFDNNLQAYESKILHYKTPSLKKGDKIVVQMYVRLAKDTCIDALGLGQKWQKPILMKRVEFIVK